ncbi:MAG: DUF2059 domain-containing protein [Chitinophagaceae bacterium]
MKKWTYLCIFLLLHGMYATAQNDSTTQAKYNADYERITGQLASYKPDTTSAPNDKITRKIRELISLRGGFNIHEAVGFMIEDERKKGDKEAAQLDRLAHYFTQGDGYRHLNNAAIWIYRLHFTYKEIKQLVKFYKTSAGKKMADDFPVVVLKSLAAAEMLKKGFEEQH